MPKKPVWNREPYYKPNYGRTKSLLPPTHIKHVILYENTNEERMLAKALSGIKRHYNWTCHNLRHHETAFVIRQTIQQLVLQLQGHGVRFLPQEVVELYQQQARTEIRSLHYTAGKDMPLYRGLNTHELEDQVEFLVYKSEDQYKKKLALSREGTLASTTERGREGTRASTTEKDKEYSDSSTSNPSTRERKLPSIMRQGTRLSREGTMHSDLESSAGETGTVKNRTKLVAPATTPNYQARQPGHSRYPQKTIVDTIAVKVSERRATLRNYRLSKGITFDTGSSRRKPLTSKSLPRFTDGRIPDDLDKFDPRFRELTQFLEPISTKVPDGYLANASVGAVTEIELNYPRGKYHNTQKREADGERIHAAVAAVQSKDTDWF